MTRAGALQLTIALQRDQEVGPTTHIGGLISGERYNRAVRHATRYTATVACFCTNQCLKSRFSGKVAPKQASGPWRSLVQKRLPTHFLCHRGSERVPVDAQRANQPHQKAKRSGAFLCQLNLNVRRITLRIDHGFLTMNTCSERKSPYLLLLPQNSGSSCQLKRSTSNPDFLSLST